MDKSTEKTISILLKFGIEKTAAENVAGSLQKTKAAMSELEKEATLLKKAIAVSLAHGEDITEFNNKLSQIEGQFKSLRNTAEKSIRDGIKTAFESNIKNVQEKAERLESLGTRLGIAGGLIFRGYIQGAEQYAQKLGRLEGISAAWNENNRSIENSQLRLGRIAADSLLPYQRFYDEILKGAADAAEQNSGLAKTILAASAAISALGGGSVVISQAMKVGTDSAMLGAAKLQNMAADKMLAAAGLQSKSAGGSLIGSLTKSAIPALAAQTAGAGWSLGAIPMAGGALGTGLLGSGATGMSMLAAATSAAGLLAAGLGVAAGSAASDKISEYTGGMKAGDFFGQSASLIAHGAGRLFGEDTANSWFLEVGKLTGQIDELSYAAKKAALETGKVKETIDPAQMTQNLQAYAAWQQAVDAQEAYEQQSNEQRNAIVAQYAAQRVQLEQQYEQQRTAATAAFLKADADALADYQTQRAQTVDSAVNIISASRFSMSFIGV